VEIDEQCLQWPILAAFVAAVRPRPFGAISGGSPAPSLRV
jgi:hypothetical protein